MPHHTRRHYFNDGPLGPPANSLPSFQYQIEGDDREDGVTSVRVRWLGKSNLKASDVLGGRDSRADAPARDQAVEILSQLMGEDGTLEAGEAKRHCQHLGITDSTRKRAVLALGWLSEAVHNDDGTIEKWVYRRPVQGAAGEGAP